MTPEGGWHRLHPLSPLIRAGRGLIALLVLLGSSLTAGRGLAEGLPQLGVVVLLALLGFVQWLVTRWRVDGADLRIETGLVRRSSRRFPLQQIQAIDLVRPGLARFFGLAELRLRLGGSTGSHARLAYLRDQEAEELRRRLLALARGEEASQPATPERVLLSIPTPRLVGSILLSRPGLVLEAAAVALVVVAVLEPDVIGAVVGSGAAVALSVGTAFWRRFNDEYRLTVAEAPDGLLLHAGLVALTSETIPAGRVQAVRMTEPLCWRPFGWCRLEVDVAGQQHHEGEGAPERRQLRAVLPVGSRRLALALLERILPETAQARLPAPRRVLLKSPLRYRHLAWGREGSCVVTTTGRVARTTDWVPLAKVQSLRRVQGPLQRRLRLATIHLDTAGRNVHAALRDRDETEADRVLVELVELARVSRGRPGRPTTAPAP